MRRLVFPARRVREEELPRFIERRAESDLRRDGRCLWQLSTCRRPPAHDRDRRLLLRTLWARCLRARRGDARRGKGRACRRACSPSRGRPVASLLYGIYAGMIARERREEDHRACPRGSPASRAGGHRRRDHAHGSTRPRACRGGPRVRGPPPAPGPSEVLGQRRTAGRSAGELSGPILGWALFRARAERPCPSRNAESPGPS